MCQYDDFQALNDCFNGGGRRTLIRPVLENAPGDHRGCKIGREIECRPELRHHDGDGSCVARNAAPRFAECGRQDTLLCKAFPSGRLTQQSAQTVRQQMLLFGERK